MYGINTIIKMWYLTASKISDSREFLNWIKWDEFLSYLWIKFVNINSEIW